MALLSVRLAAAPRRGGYHSRPGRRLGSRQAGLHPATCSWGARSGSEPAIFSILWPACFSPGGGGLDTGRSTHSHLVGRGVRLAGLPPGPPAGRAAATGGRRHRSYLRYVALPDHPGGLRTLRKHALGAAHFPRSDGAIVHHLRMVAVENGERLVRQPGPRVHQRCGRITHRVVILGWIEHDPGRLRWRVRLGSAGSFMCGSSSADNSNPTTLLIMTEHTAYSHNVQTGCEVVKS